MIATNRFLTPGFARVFVGLIAPCVGYAITPLVTWQELRKSGFNAHEKSLLIKQDIPRQAINIAIALAAFKPGGNLGKIFFQKVLRQPLSGKMETEAARTIGVAAINFLAYNFLRPTLSWRIFDKWQNGSKPDIPPVIQKPVQTPAQMHGPAMAALQPTPPPVRVVSRPVYGATPYPAAPMPASISPLRPF